MVVEHGSLRWVAGGIAVLVAVCTSALKTFKYQENWINYSTTYKTLRKEFHYYEAGIHGYEDVAAREALFVDRVESLISRGDTLWVIAHNRDENKAQQHRLND